MTRCCLARPEFGWVLWALGFGTVLTLSVSSMSSHISLSQQLTKISYRARILAKRSKNQSTAKEEADLHRELESWLPRRAKFMGATHEHSETEDASDIVTMPLRLPSDLPMNEIRKLGFLSLLQREVDLRHGQLCTIILQCRTTVKLMDVARVKKASTARGQDANTRANAKIAVLEDRRDFTIAEYNRVRRKLLRLGDDYLGGFPAMTIADLYRKSTVDGRNVGDSKRTDGKFWGDHRAGPSQLVMTEVVGEISEGVPGRSSESMSGECMCIPCQQTP
jgi:hypothetical protein